MPLLAGDHTVGVLSLHFQESAPLATEQRDLLDAFVRQIALVLDRQRLRDAEQRARDEKLIRQEILEPHRRPDLEDDVVSGIQSRNASKALGRH